MREFLLFCVKYWYFIFVLIIVIKVRNSKKNKIKKEEQQRIEDTSQVKYTFSSVFPDKETENKVFEIIQEIREKEKNENQ